MQATAYRSSTASGGGSSSQEKTLLDYTRRIGKDATQRRAVHIHLSRLRPYNQRDHHLRVARNACDSLISRFDGAIFQLYNNDLILIVNKATVSEIDETVLRLRYLFSDDPLLAGDFDMSEDQFCTWYDLLHEYPDFLALTVKLEEDLQKKLEQDRLDAIAAQQRNAPVRPTAPIDPSQLDAIAKSITQADLSSVLKRQPIYMVTPGQKPEPLFRELFFSIEQLQRTLLPSHNLLANRWLFQDLTRYLDQRMLVLLRQQDDSSLNRAYSLNLNVSTVLSNEFLKLDETLGDANRKSIVIEFQLLDIFADVGSFTFARDFLRDRGYKLCLDGITHLSLPMIDRQKMGFDLVKLQWNQDLTKFLMTKRGGDIHAAVRNMDSKRVVLCHCGAAEALEVGQAMGVNLFQGFFLDQLVKENKTVDYLAEGSILAKAIARHRADTD